MDVRGMWKEIYITIQDDISHERKRYCTCSSLSIYFSNNIILLAVRIFSFGLLDVPEGKIAGPLSIMNRNYF